MMWLSVHPDQQGRGLGGALLAENGPDELVRQVRAAEATDPEARQWPRTKRSDDATAAYLVLSDD